MALRKLAKRADGKWQARAVRWTYVPVRHHWHVRSLS